MPEIFHLLYSCGMRIDEVLQLSIADVNLITGVLKICDGKFRKNRLIPLALSTTDRLKKYTIKLGEQKSDAFFSLNQYFWVLGLRPLGLVIAIGLLQKRATLPGNQSASNCLLDVT